MGGWNPTTSHGEAGKMFTVQYSVLGSMPTLVLSPHLSIVSLSLYYVQQWSFVLHPFKHRNRLSSFIWYYGRLLRGGFFLALNTSFFFFAFVPSFFSPFLFSVHTRGWSVFIIIRTNSVFLYFLFGITHLLFTLLSDMCLNPRAGKMSSLVCWSRITASLWEIILGCPLPRLGFFLPRTLMCSTDCRAVKCNSVSLHLEPRVCYVSAQNKNINITYVIFLGAKASFLPLPIFRSRLG